MLQILNLYHRKPGIQEGRYSHWQCSQYLDLNLACEIVVQRSLDLLGHFVELLQSTPHSLTII